MDKIISLFFLILFVVCLYVLLFQPGFLGIVLLQKPVLPFGAMVAWVMLVSYSFFMYYISGSNKKSGTRKFLKLLMKIPLYLAFVWGFVSFLLSGNWTYSFENKTSFTLWVLFTALILIFPAVISIFIFMKRIFTSKSGLD